MVRAWVQSGPITTPPEEQTVKNSMRRERSAAAPDGVPRSWTRCSHSSAETGVSRCGGTRTQPRPPLQGLTWRPFLVADAGQLPGLLYLPAKGMDARTLSRSGHQPRQRRRLDSRRTPISHPRYEHAGGNGGHQSAESPDQAVEVRRCAPSWRKKEIPSASASSN